MRRRNPTSAEQKSLIQKAIDLLDGQVPLAHAMGTRQQTVSKLVRGEIAVSAEWALRLDRATGGAVPKESLRPDLFRDEVAA